MKTFRATVLGRRPLSPHLVSVTLEVEDGFTTTGIPDEYLRVLIPPAGAELVLPEIGENYSWTYPEGAVEPTPRVYTVSDHRIVEGATHIDIDVALHDQGVGAEWARTCQPGDVVGLTEPHGLYQAPADVPDQVLVCDLTGVPALARILRGLQPDQRADVVVVVTDAADEIPLPSPADVSITWQVVDWREVSDTLTAAVVDRQLPADLSEGQFVWLAGEARSSRAVRKHLRRELRWPQSLFYTCGYWQIDAEQWNARYEEVSEQVIAEAIEAHQAAEGDEGIYLDALDDIYERAGL